MNFKLTFYNLRFEIFQPKLNANSEEGLNPHFNFLPYKVRIVTGIYLPSRVNESFPEAIKKEGIALELQINT